MVREVLCVLLEEKGNQPTINPVTCNSDGFTKYTSASVLLWLRLFPLRHPSPLALTVFLPSLPHRCLSVEGRILIKTSYLELSAAKFLSLCIFSSCSSLNSHLLQIEASVMQLSDALIYGYSNISLGVILLLRSRTYVSRIVLGFHLSP